MTEPLNAAFLPNLFGLEGGDIVGSISMPIHKIAEATLAPIFLENDTLYIVLSISNIGYVSVVPAEDVMDEDLCLIYIHALADHYSAMKGISEAFKKLDIEVTDLSQAGASAK